MPKMIYLGILFVLTLLVVAFAGMIREKQDRVSKSIFTLFVAVVVAVVANGIFIMTDEKAIAAVSHSVFLACIDWLLLFMLRYVYFYTDNEEKQVKWMTPCYLVAGLETVSMLLNPWLHHVFILKEAFSKSYGAYFYPTGYSGIFMCIWLIVMDWLPGSCFC